MCFCVLFAFSEGEIEPKICVVFRMRTATYSAVEKGFHVQAGSRFPEETTKMEASINNSLNLKANFNHSKQASTLHNAYAISYNLH